MVDQFEKLVERGDIFRIAENSVPKVVESLSKCGERVYSLEVEQRTNCVRISFEGHPLDFRFIYREKTLELGSRKVEKTWKFNLDGTSVDTSIEDILVDIIDTDF